MPSEAVTIGGLNAKPAYEISAIHTISASYPYDQCNQTHRVNTWPAPQFPVCHQL